MRVGYVQFNPRLGDPAYNLERAEALVRSVSADLLVLPELFTTGYQFRTRADLRPLAVEAQGSTFVERMAGLSRATGATLVGGFAERSGEDLYNSALVVTPGGLAGVYRKVHLYGREKELFSPGDRGFPVFDVGQARIGLMVCFDWIFPEAARALALAGADILCHPSNLVLPWGQDAMRIRALENGVFSITANRIGSEGRLTFTGGSQVTDRHGEVLLRAERDQEAVSVVEIDPATARDKRLASGNDLLAERRPDQYTFFNESAEV